MLLGCCYLALFWASVHTLVAVVVLQVVLFGLSPGLLPLPLRSLICWTRFSLSAFTWHSRKPNYCVSPTMIGFLRCMYTP